MRNSISVMYIHGCANLKPERFKSVLEFHHLGSIDGEFVVLTGQLVSSLSCPSALTGQHTLCSNVAIPPDVPGFITG